jgi:hypothetical protein
MDTSSGIYDLNYIVVYSQFVECQCSCFVTAEHIHSGHLFDCSHSFGNSTLQTIINRSSHFLEYSYPPFFYFGGSQKALAMDEYSNLLCQFV